MPELAPVSPEVTSDNDQVNGAAFLQGGGVMGELIRAFDWAATPLGPPEQWPLPLRTTVRILLTTGHPAFIFWGPELRCFYNDAYSRSIGPEKHPGILGGPGRDAWAEIWDIIGPQIDFVMAGERSDLARERAGADHPPRQEGRCLLDLRLQPHRRAGFPTRRWRCAGPLHRDD